MTGARSKAATQFFDGPNIEKKVRELLKDVGPVRVAVAYWGEGAVGRLGLERLKGRDIRIYCNVASGGCNVTEIKLLQQAIGPANVKTCDTLHSKAWVTKKHAIIGSSNASTNGYGIEGSDAAELLEANVWTTSGPIIDDLTEWINRSVHAASRPIRETDYKVGDKNWHARAKNQRTRPGRSTVLDHLRANPLAYEHRNIFVMVSPVGSLTKRQERELEEKGKELDVKKLNGWTSPSPKEERLLVGDSIVIEFDSTKGLFKNEGIFRVLSKENRIGLLGGERALLCQELPSLFGSRLGNANQWRKAAKQALDESDQSDGWIGTLHEFSRYLST